MCAGIHRSVVEPPLMRINECDSADLASVCEHYSGCVVTYVESILASVPEAMLDTLLEAAGLARSVPALAEPPSRIERAKLREYAVPDIRRKMAALSRRLDGSAVPARCDLSGRCVMCGAPLIRSSLRGLRRSVLAM